MKFAVNHDLHCHSVLSSCCADPAMSVQAIYERAQREKLEAQCVTDHLWDAAVPGASAWYQSQDIAHVEQSLPQIAALRQSQAEGEPKLYFGCETEYCGDGKLGLAPEHFDRFDFIIIPPNHFHMKNFTRLETADTAEKIAELFTKRLEELSQMDLPWHKIGIAHLNCSLTFAEGDYTKVFRTMDEDRLKAAFSSMVFRCAGKTRVPVGIEINTSCFGPGWEEHQEDHLRLLKIARDAGCRFYVGSDAHGVEEMAMMQERARRVADLLELTETERFRIDG